MTLRYTLPAEKDLKMKKIKEYFVSYQAVNKNTGKIAGYGHVIFKNAAGFDNEMLVADCIAAIKREINATEDDVINLIAFNLI